jgi:hypothetical protein
MKHNHHEDTKDTKKKQRENFVSRGESFLVADCYRLFRGDNPAY